MKTQLYLWEYWVRELDHHYPSDQADPSRHPQADLLDLRSSIGRWDPGFLPRTRWWLVSPADMRWPSHHWHIDSTWIAPELCHASGLSTGSAHYVANECKQLQFTFAYACRHGTWWWWSCFVITSSKAVKGTSINWSAVTGKSQVGLICGWRDADEIISDKTREVRSWSTGRHGGNKWPRQQIHE